MKRAILRAETVAPVRQEEIKRLGGGGRPCPPFVRAKHDAGGQGRPPPPDPSGYFTP